MRAHGSGWRHRLVEDPLAWFERHFGPAVESEASQAQSFPLAGKSRGRASRMRTLLEDLGELPLVCEHRDCSPWNILIAPSGDPVLLDWESAEPDGLPGPDLVYFLANCAFVLDGAIESGRTRESYARLLDPSTPYGRVAAKATDHYRTALGISADDFRRLRLLTWIVHSRSDYRHLLLESPDEPAPEALRSSMFLGLVEGELKRD